MAVKVVRVEDLDPGDYVCVFVAGAGDDEHVADDRIYSYGNKAERADARSDAEGYAYALAKRIGCEVEKAYG